MPSELSTTLVPRLQRLVKRYDTIELELDELKRRLRRATGSVNVVAKGSASSISISHPRPALAAATTAAVDLSALQPDPQDPPEVANLRKYCLDAGLHSASFHWVPSNYYQENLQWRRDALKAPSIQHLCKTILMENTHCVNSDCTDVNNARFYLVVYQYVDRFQLDRIGRVIQERNPGMGKKKFHFRIADPGDAEKLTGVRSGAVAPFGTTSPVPVILSASITQLSPPVFYVGGGHVDCKCRLDTAEYVRMMSAVVAPITEPLSEEELLQIAD